MQLALFQQKIQELENDLDARFKDMRRTFGDGIALAESRILDRVQANGRQLNVIEGDIQKGEEQTARALHNIIDRTEGHFAEADEALKHLGVDNAETRRQLHSLFVSVDGGFT